CNCDTSSCIALRQLRTYGIKRNLEGHFVADLDWDACNGCGECVKRCQFSALMLSPKEKKVVHDKFSCYGCGLCVSVCPVQAFSMVPRETFPALLETWGKPKV
ncbi:MAG: 4Fe-4S binding protein, partial [Desulfatiglandales bacterium]|nr:4Fe-4S binding protein [Desulfatiglandales bacterium]